MAFLVVSPLFVLCSFFVRSLVRLWFVFGSFGVRSGFVIKFSTIRPGEWFNDFQIMAAYQALFFIIVFLISEKLLSEHP